MIPFFRNFLVFFVPFKVGINSGSCISNTRFTIALVITSLFGFDFFWMALSVFGASLSAARLALTVKTIKRFGMFAKFCCWQELLAF